MVEGLHHITSLTKDPKKTVGFYRDILGLRMVKKTVNHDAPDTYHLYFANYEGTPGTTLTFFTFKGLQNGVVGTGQVAVAQFSVPVDSLDFWEERLNKNKINCTRDMEFDHKVLNFEDPDGLKYQLVEENNKFIKPYTQIIESKYAINGFFGSKIEVETKEYTEVVLQKILGYSKIEEENNTIRYKNETGEYANTIDLIISPNDTQGIPGYGTVHHIAFRLQNTDQQNKLRERIMELGLYPTQIIDRFYFKSIYFRDKNGILFELATNGPGFDIDEPMENLGENLVLPPWLEPQRQQILNLLEEV